MSALDWTAPEVRWAMVRLLTIGELRRNRGNAALVDWLRQLNWLRQGGRRDLFLLNPERRTAVEQRLASGWPDWQRELAALSDAGLSLDETGLRELHRRSLPLLALPPRLHRKTWAARFGVHSKTGSPDRRPPESLTLTDDDLLRLRPNRGLRLRFADGDELDCSGQARRFGELIIPQRTMDDGLHLTGKPPTWVMTVENLGAYIDLPAPPEALIVHQPGWNRRLAGRLIALLTRSIPWWHFGDLDPEGIRIYESLVDSGDIDDTNKDPRPRLFLPPWWSDYLDTHGLSPAGVWPSAPSPGNGSSLLGALRATGRSLEQEAILLDPRLVSALAGLDSYSIDIASVYPEADEPASELVHHDPLLDRTSNRDSEFWDKLAKQVGRSPDEA